MADQTSDDQRFRLSRRTALAGLAATCAAGFAGSGSHAADENPGGPIFSPSGPNADHYGAAENYPIKDPALGFVPGNPLQPKYRVGAFSHYAELFPTRTVKQAATPWQFKRAPGDMRIVQMATSLSGCAAHERGGGSRELRLQCC